MKIMKSYAALVASALLLAACGGGGGGGTGGSSSDGSTGDQGWLSFTPNPVTVNAVQGQSTPFTVSAHANKTISQNFNIGIIEATGLVTTQVDLSGGGYDYTATLHVSPALTVGTRTGTLLVKLCEDDPTVCNKPLSGSPWRIPLTVNVTASGSAPTTPTTPTNPTNPTTPVTPPAPVGLQFDKSAYAYSFTQGEPFSFSFNSTASRTLLGEAQVGVFEKTGLLSGGGGTLNSTGDKTYAIDLPLNGNLAVGQYSSTLEVRVCQDDPSICSKPVSGSPWKIPLTLAVTSPTNLKPLSALPGVPSWGTHQGNAAHTGAIDAVVTPANFTRRFNVTNAGQTGFTIATDGNMFYVVAGDRFGKWTVKAISEDTSAEVWHVDLGTLSRVNPPAAANGKVYVTSTGHEDSYLWIFDQRDGKLLAKQAMSSQWENYLAPTIYGGNVYSDYGYYGGMAKYDGVSAAPQWQVGLAQFDGWTPAVDSQFAYTYVNGTFHALNAATGVVAYTVVDPRYSWHGWSADGSVVLGSGMLFAVDGGRLSAMNLGTRAITWYLQGNGVTGQPALGAKALYVLHANGTVLEAHDPVTGTQQWVATLNGTYRNLIVTTNLAFVSNETTTLAIDLATQKTVWTYPLGGTLAISNRGVLYITAPNKIAAINLQ